MQLTRACVARFLLILGLASAAFGTSARGEDVVLDTRRYVVTAGRYSVFGEFQGRLQELLSRCRSDGTTTVSDAERKAGKIGAGTRAAIIEALACPELSSAAQSSLARQGVITDAVWRAVMQTDQVPTPFERAQAMVLSFEATDYAAAPEWNLCQDGVATSRTGGFECFNASDPCSYLTWGPRGATAGSGREIQLILRQLEREEPHLLQQLFGAEYPHLQRFYGLKTASRESCAGAVPMKVFLCAVWMAPERKAIWDQAFARLGENAKARSIYERLYSATEFDGAKLGDFSELWQALGLYSSEIDVAFFLDRATHLGGPPDRDDKTIGAMKRCMAEQRGALSRHGAARRCLARLQPHRMQLQYRLARDVAYYLDAYPEGGLSEREIQAWSGYVPISAGLNLGLRDDRRFAIAPSSTLSALGIETVAEQRDDVTAEERKACPASVLTPLRTRRP